MGVESTFRINRADAIKKLAENGVYVFHNDCTERLEAELYNLQEEHVPGKNYEVVEFTQETEPEDNKWHLWEY